MPITRTTNFRCSADSQRGGILLIMLVLLVVGVAAVLINSLTTVATKNARQEKTSAALAQAKEALIGFAVTYGDTHSGQVHGYLPCPDTNGSPEGSANPPCLGTNVNVIGRLPWATLDLSTLRDGNGECLWYTVSGTYKDNPKTGLMNWDTNGQFQVYASDGTLLASQVVAVIFAPGAPLSGQNRSPDGTAPICGGNYTAANYLDNETVPVPGITVHGINNADVAIGKFIQPHDHRDVNGNILLTMNDQMVFITKQDIWNAIQKRTDFQPTLKLLTQRVAECLADYGHNNGGGWGSGWGGGSNNSLPWPAPLVFPVGIDYSGNANYNDSATLFAGRVPNIVDNSINDSTNNMNGNLLMPALVNGNPVNNNLICPRENNSAALTELERLYPWWVNWKDHLFYALGQAFKPSSNTDQSCGTCLSINGSGHYAAVVMFANNSLAGTSPAQVRISNTISTNPITSNRGDISNYLESNNASNFTNASGNENYKSATASSTFNDVLCTIDGNLNVNCP